MSGARTGEILFLAHRIPFPPDRGDKIRSFNIVKRLAEIAPVHIAAFADDAADAAHEDGLRAALGAGLASCRIVPRRRSRAISLMLGAATGRSASTAAFANGSMRRHISLLIADPAVASIFAFSGQMGQYVREKREETRFVMDFVDVDSAKFESYADGAKAPLRWLYRREAARLAHEEAAIAQAADVSLFVTGAEADLFRARAGASSGEVAALENGVDLAYFNPTACPAAPPKPLGGPLLVFSGQMDYPPNVQATAFFAREVLPRIRNEIAGATFAIVGRNPAAAVRALMGLEGVAVIGAVGDMRPWLAAADLVVAPLQVARGIQNKVLEAMAMARPVIASSAAFEGIDAARDKDLVVADGIGATADACVALLRDGERASAMGRKARVRVCERYAWDRQLAALPDLVFG